MNKLSKRFVNFLLQEDGIAATEYLVLLGVLVGGVLAAAVLLGSGLSGAFTAWGNFLPTIVP